MLKIIFITSIMFFIIESIASYQWEGFPSDTVSNNLQTVICKADILTLHLPDCIGQFGKAFCVSSTSFGLTKLFIGFILCGFIFTFS